MVVLNAKPGQTEVQVTARGRANKIPPELRKVPGGLYPLMSSAWEVDEYRIMAGWPVPVPELDIQVDVTVTGDGSVLGNRDAPTSLLTEADMRWVADDAYYDINTLTWTALQGDVSGWQTSTDHAPTLVHDYEYRVEDERFVGMTALNFDSNTDDYMWINLSQALGGTNGYTVIMVVSPNSIYGNDEAVTSNGLWGPPDTDGDDAWVSFSVRDQAVCMTSDERRSQVGVPIRDQLNLTAPTYLALVVGKPQTTLYAAVGPSRVKVKSLVAGEAATSLRTDFWLGNTPGANSDSMDMALLDLGIYGRQLSAFGVRREFATLSGVYGGDS